MLTTLARWRVPLGFACAALAFVLVQPSHSSWLLGASVAAIGEAVRLWAAGHIEKGREITRSGPYRFVRHPLYLGSVLLGTGFVIAGRSLVVGLLCAIYLGVTLAAAIRTEESTLDARFSGEYSAYRAGLSEPASRRFSWTRVKKNREYRAVMGVAAAFLWLWFAIG
jgi:protein-S-isoprenylcysteine O-methyltransferase Ste14